MPRLLPVGFLLCWALSLLACQRGPVKPYNLIISSDGGDPNGLLLNPLWGFQFEHPGQFPTPLAPPNEPWTESQTDWNLGFDDEWDCTWNDGNTHFNWVGGPLRAGTYTGLISWHGHSSSFWADDDYKFYLAPSNGASLQSGEEFLTLEYKADEVGDRFDPETSWWQAFHHAVDNNDAVPSARDMVSNRFAVVTGLLGMDREHPLACELGGKTEIHPVWAMAIRVKDDDPSDETYAFMARNWGNEGYCSDEQWTLSRETLTLFLPWRPGAEQILGVGGTFSVVNPADESDIGKNVSVTFAGSSGLLLSFKLQKQPQDEPDEDGTVIEGELHIHWGGRIIQPHESVRGVTPLSAGARLGKENDGPEDVVRGLVEEMTPQQRTMFLAALPKPKPRKRSYYSQIGQAVQVAALPARPRDAVPPTIGHVRSKYLMQAGKARRDALHAIFGDTIPGIVVRGKKSATGR